MQLSCSRVLSLQLVLLRRLRKLPNGGRYAHDTKCMPLPGSEDSCDWKVLNISSHSHGVRDCKS